MLSVDETILYLDFHGTHCHAMEPMAVELHWTIFICF